jgi:adenylate cyclase
VDIFAVQDEITCKVVTQLDIHLYKGEQARYWSSSTTNLKAWECFRRGRDLLDNCSADEFPEVTRLVKRAIELDPEYAAAWQILSSCHFHIVEDGRYSEQDRRSALQSMQDCANRALKIDPTCAGAYSLLGLYHLHLKEFDAAISNTNKAVEMEPNHASNLAISAIILSKSGQPERGIERVRKAMLLCPVFPLWYLAALGQVLRALRRSDDAIEAYLKMTKRGPDNLQGQIGLAEMLGEVGRVDEAKAVAVEVIRINPDFSTKDYIGNLSFRDPAEIERYQDGLRKAGLPE